MATFRKDTLLLCSQEIHYGKLFAEKDENSNIFNKGHLEVIIN